MRRFEATASLVKSATALIALSVFWLEPIPALAQEHPEPEFDAELAPASALDERTDEQKKVPAQSTTTEPRLTEAEARRPGRRAGSETPCASRRRRAG